MHTSLEPMILKQLLREYYVTTGRLLFWKESDDLLERELAIRYWTVVACTGDQFAMQALAYAYGQPGGCDSEAAEPLCPAGNLSHHAGPPEKTVSQNRGLYGVIP